MGCKKKLKFLETEDKETGRIKFETRIYKEIHRKEGNRTIFGHPYIAERKFWKPIQIEATVKERGKGK